MQDTILAKENFGYAKENRLLVPKDFKQVFDTCHFKVHQSHLMFFVHIRPNEAIATTSTASRLGLAITKKKVKRAHERNRVKRLTREYFRLHQADLPVAVDMVLTIKQTPQDLTNAQIVEQLAAAFQLIDRKLVSRLTQKPSSSR